MDAVGVSCGRATAVLVRARSQVTVRTIVRKNIMVGNDTVPPPPKKQFIYTISETSKKHVPTKGFFREQANVESFEDNCEKKKSIWRASIAYRKVSRHC
jgi:hypothetical protein